MMHHHFLALCRLNEDDDENEEKLCTLMGFQNYRATLDCDFWFCLYKSDQILAECSVLSEYHASKRRFWQKPANPHSYSIWDVFVPPEQRGNNYALLLLLNVIAYLEKRCCSPDNNNPVLEIRLQSFEHNPAACKTYDKIFGAPEKRIVNSYGKVLLHYFLRAECASSEI